MPQARIGFRAMCGQIPMVAKDVFGRQVGVCAAAIKDHDRMAYPGKLAHDVGTDEASAANDHNPHLTRLLPPGLPDAFVLPERLQTRHNV